MSIPSLIKKSSYPQTGETSFLTSKAEVTQDWIDINYSLEIIAHICASHQYKGEVAIRKVAQFGVDNRKDQKLLKAKTWPGNALRGSRESMNSQAYKRRLYAGSQAPSSRGHISSAEVPTQCPRPAGAKHWRTTKSQRNLEGYLVQPLWKEQTDLGLNFSLSCLILVATGSPGVIAR